MTLRRANDGFCSSNCAQDIRQIENANSNNIPQRNRTFRDLIAVDINLFFINLADIVSEH